MIKDEWYTFTLFIITVSLRSFIEANEENNAEYSVQFCHWTFSQNYAHFGIFFTVAQFGITCRVVRDHVSLNTWSPTLQRDLLLSSPTRVVESSGIAVARDAASHMTDFKRKKKCCTDVTIYHYMFRQQFMLLEYLSKTIRYYVTTGQRWILWTSDYATGFRFQSEARKCFTLPKCSDRFLGPPSCVPSVYNWVKTVGGWRWPFITSIHTKFKNK
jgi:hypothetical protein